tara:strand:- start:1507 stop:2517 length:1011 start_codon:yes stop_codon:yes gene_type:complete
MWSNSNEERLQHMYLERDYLRTIDNVLLNIEILNSRYHTNDFLRNSRNNRNNRRNNRNRTWNSWTRPNRNYIYSSGTHSTPIPPPPPPPLPPPPPPIFPPPNLWSRPSTRMNTSTNTNLGENLTNFINNTLYTPSRPDFPTYNQVIRATTTTNFSDLSNNNCTICPISRDNFEPNDIVLQINHCGHIFKKNSLLSWFETNSKCPVCRYDIRQQQPNVQQPNVRQLRTNRILAPTTTNTYSNSTDTTNLYSTLGRNLFNSDLSNNIIFDSNNNNNLNNFITQNLTNVLDNIGSSVIENLAGSVEQALNQTLNTTDLSNNNISTAFGYTLQFPPNSIR